MTFKTKILTGLACATLLLATTVLKVFTPLQILPNQDGSTVAEVRFLGTNGNYLGLKGRVSPASNCSWVLPAVDGSSGQFLQTNGSCSTTWAAASGGSGTVTSVATTSPITGGTITTTGTIACATCVTSAASLTSNQVVLGSGSQGSQALGSLGTTTTVLHGNAGGAPSFGAVSLSADVSGNLGVSHQNSGTSASSTTFWRGDATWATPSSGGISGQATGNPWYGTPTSSRALGTTYQNLTGSPIFVTVSATSTVGGYLEAYTDNNSSPSTAVAVNGGPAGVADSYVGFWVLNNNYYKVIGTGTAALAFWTEWN